MAKTRGKSVTDGTAKEAEKPEPFKPGRAVIQRVAPKAHAIAWALSSLRRLEADFNKFGPQAIAHVRQKKPRSTYKVVADLLPKEANINVEAGEAFVNLWRRISDGLGDELADSLDAEQEQSAPVRH